MKSKVFIAVQWSPDALPIMGRVEADTPAEALESFRTFANDPDCPVVLYEIPGLPLAAYEASAGSSELTPLFEQDQQLVFPDDVRLCRLLCKS